MKNFAKILKITLIFLIASSYFLAIAKAQSPCAPGYTLFTDNNGAQSCVPGVITCEGAGCQFADIFNTIQNVINLIVLTIAPPLTIILFVVGGIIVMVSSGNPGLRQTGTSILKSTLIGLLIVVGAGLILGTVLRWVYCGSDLASSMGSAITFQNLQCQ